MRIVIVVLALGLAACASGGGKDVGAGNAAVREGLGSQADPVRVNMPAGERAYLSRLRCSNGAAPAFTRLGSGPVNRDGHILDIYDVRCTGGESSASQIWMDMYHPNHNETAAPPGFTLAPDSPAPSLSTT